MKYTDSLPIAMKLAAKCVSLDKIKIIPVNCETGIRHKKKTLIFYGWENRLINKMVKTINNDIDVSIEKDKNLKFYVYIMGSNFYRKNIFFMCLDSHYEIK